MAPLSRSRYDGLGCLDAALCFFGETDFIFGSSTNPRQYYPLGQRGLRLSSAGTSSLAMGCDSHLWTRSAGVAADCLGMARPRASECNVAAHRGPCHERRDADALSIMMRPLPPHCLHRGANTRCPGTTGCLTLIVPVPPQAGQCFSLGTGFSLTTPHL